MSLDASEGRRFLSGNQPSNQRPDTPPSQINHNLVVLHSLAAFDGTQVSEETIVAVVHAGQSTPFKQPTHIFCWL